MSYNPHLDQPVTHEGASLNQATAAVIALHGRGRDPEDIMTVCRRIGIGDLAWLAPAASEGTWYPEGFMAPLEANEPALTWTRDRIATLIDEITGHGIPLERVVLLGFSQGACAVSEYAVRNPRRYGGVIVFTGGLAGPPGTRWEYGGDFEGTPAFMGGSREDEWVPFERMQETLDVLRARGALVREHFYPGKDHVVCDEEVAVARAIIADLA